MNTYTILYTLCILLAVLYLKHILFVLYYFFSALDAIKYRHRNLLTRGIGLFYTMLESWLFRGGGKRALIIRIGTIPSVWLRGKLYGGLGARIGKNTTFHYKTEIRDPHSLSIGNGTRIGDNVILDARRGLTIGSNVNINSNVSIYTEQHDHRDPNFACFEGEDLSVKIEDRVWIGPNSIVLPRVKIGEGAVCCAGCVVTKDVEPYTVVAGIPAKKVGERPRHQIYEFDDKVCWFY